MFEYGFNNYKNYLIIDKEHFSIDKNFYEDKVYVKQSFQYPLSESEIEKVSIIAEILKLSNYKNNDKVGEIIVKLDDKEIFRENIYVQVGVKDDKTFFGKLKEFFSSIFG